MKTQIPAKYRHQAALDAQAHGIARIYQDRRRRIAQRDRWMRRSAWLILVIVLAFTAVGVARLALKHYRTPQPVIPAIEEAPW